LRQRVAIFGGLAHFLNRGPTLLVLLHRFVSLQTPHYHRTKRNGLCYKNKLPV
jgi:hypothetical protein